MSDHQRIGMWLEPAPLSLVGTFVVCVVSFYLFKWFSNETSVQIRDSSKNHSWTPLNVTSKSWYCSICESLLLHGIGVYCDCCGVCADPECVRKANETLRCKAITTSQQEHTFVHHWIKGNLPLGAVCYMCDEECCIEPGLVDFRCCWCQRNVHESCRTKSSIASSDVCDLGQYKSIIVPPWCVQVARRKGALARRLLLRGVREPDFAATTSPPWSPIVVIANKRSGSNDGAVVLSEFRKLLNPIQVVDLSERKPLTALQWCVVLAPRQLRFIVAGGDGTVSWVLSTAHQLDLDPEPAIAIIPLGTGNDLSRVLGWGKEHTSELDAHQLLSNVQRAKIVQLDRWRIEIISKRHLGLRIPSKVMHMYNYMGIGVDAQVTLNFHKTRDSAFYPFGNRIFNKMLYLCFGTHQVVQSDCKNLERRLELLLDGKRVSLPELEAVVVLNIGSWGAGVNLWAMSSQQDDSATPKREAIFGCGATSTTSTERRTSHSYHDGVLEVFGIYSSFHIAQLQMGMSQPLSIGQAKSVQIKLLSKTAVQVDGEPWEQHPATINISLANRCSVLVHSS